MQPGKPSCAWVNLCARSAGQADAFRRAEEYDVDDSDAHGSDGMEDDEFDADDFF